MSVNFRCESFLFRPHHLPQKIFKVWRSEVTQQNMDTSNSRLYNTPAGTTHSTVIAVVGKRSFLYGATVARSPSERRRARSTGTSPLGTCRYTTMLRGNQSEESAFHKHGGPTYGTGTTPTVHVAIPPLLIVLTLVGGMCGTLLSARE